MRCCCESGGKVKRGYLSDHGANVARADNMTTSAIHTYESNPDVPLGKDTRQNNRKECNLSSTQEQAELDCKTEI